jgi:hypothetical protein
LKFQTAQWLIQHGQRPRQPSFSAFIVSAKNNKESALSQEKITGHVN